MMMMASSLLDRWMRRRASCISMQCVAVFMLLLWCTAAAAAAAYQLSLVPDVSVVHRRSGDSLVVGCEIVDANGHRVGAQIPSSSTMWWTSSTGARVPADASARVHMEQTDERIYLRFKNVSIADHGEWSCRWSDGPALAKSFSLKTKEAVSIQADSVEFAPLGQRFLIGCVVQSHADTKVRWKKGAQKLKIGRSHPEYEITEAGLLVRKVKVSDNDTFWCTAYTFKTGVMIDHPIRVVVSEPVTAPHITCENDPCAVIGKEAVLYCFSSAIPPARFQWSLGPRLISPILDNETKMRSSSDLKYHIEENRLVIKNFSVSDNGVYQCRAFNGYDAHGKVARIELTGQVPPRIDPIAPATVTLNQPSGGGGGGASAAAAAVEFECRVHGSPSSKSHTTIRWLLGDNRTLVRGDGDTRVLLLDEHGSSLVSRLRFSHPTKHDMGAYTCEAINPAGRASATTTLKVRFRPEHVPGAASVFFAVDEHDANVSCLFDGYPLPSVQWRDARHGGGGGVLHKGSMGAGFRVVDVARVALSAFRVQSVLTVRTSVFGSGGAAAAAASSPPDLELPFTCDTGGAGGGGVASARVRLKRALPPKKLLVSETAEISRDRIAFAVSLPPDTGGAPVQYISVRSKALASQDEPFVAPFTTHRFDIKTSGAAAAPASVPIVIGDLVPNKLYRISVAAHTIAGDSEPYDNIFRTPGKAAPAFSLYEPDDLAFFNSTNLSAATAAAAASEFSERELVRQSDEAPHKFYSCHHFDKCWIRWKVASDGGDAIARVSISRFALNPKSLQRAGKERVVVVSSAQANRHLLTDLSPLSIYEVKVTVANRADLSAHKRLIVSTLRAPLGYRPNSSAGSMGVFAFLACLFAVTFILGVICVALPCLRASKIARTARDKHHRSPQNKIDGAGAGGFTFGSDSASVQSSFVGGGGGGGNGHNNNHHHNNNNNSPTSTTAPTFSDGNVNPLYNENMPSTSPTWNVLSSSPRASGGAFHASRIDSRFSRV